MSVKVMGKVWDLDLPHNQLLVLLSLADHADHEGNNVFPSLGLTAWKTGYSTQQIRRIMRELEDAKILIAINKKPGRKAVYRIDTSAGKQKPEYIYTPSKMSQVSKSNPLHPDTPTPDILPEENTGINHHIESSNSIVGENSNTKPRNAMYDAIETIWKYTAARNGQLAKMLQGTSTNRTYKEYNLETPITPEQLLQWASWYRRTELKGNAEMSMVESPIKIQSSITHWQQERQRIEQQTSDCDPAHDLSIAIDFKPVLQRAFEERQS